MLSEAPSRPLKNEKQFLLYNSHLQVFFLLNFLFSAPLQDAHPANSPPDDYARLFGQTPKCSPGPSCMMCKFENYANTHRLSHSPVRALHFRVCCTNRTTSSDVNRLMTGQKSPTLHRPLNYPILHPLHMFVPVCFVSASVKKPDGGLCRKGSIKLILKSEAHLNRRTGGANSCC